jgi:DNA topoisomerase-1
MVTVPDGIAPDELTLELALELLLSKSGDAPPIAEDTATGRAITLQRGRFGEYLELAQTEDEKESKAKPRRVSLPKGMKGADVTAEIAQQLMLLPKKLGQHPESGADISTGLGRYGPFLKTGDEFRSLQTWEQACTLTLPEAIEILKTPKPARRGFGAKKVVLKELGKLPGAAGDVQLLDGRYGPYVTDGDVNASLPKGKDPESLTNEEAAALLEARRKAPKKKKRRTRRS